MAAHHLAKAAILITAPISYHYISLLCIAKLIHHEMK